MLISYVFESSFFYFPLIPKSFPQASPDWAISIYPKTSKQIFHSLFSVPQNNSKAQHLVMELEKPNGKFVALMVGLKFNGFRSRIKAFESRFTDKLRDAMHEGIKKSIFFCKYRKKYKRYQMKISPSIIRRKENHFIDEKSIIIVDNKTRNNNLYMNEY